MSIHGIARTIFDYAWMRRFDESCSLRLAEGVNKQSRSGSIESSQIGADLARHWQTMHVLDLSLVEVNEVETDPTSKWPMGRVRCRRILELSSTGVITSCSIDVTGFWVSCLRGF